MKAIITCAFLFITILSVYTQKKVITGDSKAQSFSITPEFKRGLPPNLFADLSFEDGNRNGIIESNENGNLNIKLTNKGRTCPGTYG